MPSSWAKTPRPLLPGYGEPSTSSCPRCSATGPRARGACECSSSDPAAAASRRAAPGPGCPEVPEARGLCRPGVLHLRLHRHQRRDHGQRSAAAVPLGPLRTTPDPLRAHRRGGARGACRPRCGDGRRGAAAGVPHRGRRGGARGAEGHQGTGHRLRQRPPRPARGSPRGHRRPRPGPAARSGRLPALQPSDAGGRIRDRARRRPVRARDREGGCGAHRALPLRQDPHQHVPRAHARDLRGELSAGR